MWAGAFGFVINRREQPRAVKGIDDGDNMWPAVFVYCCQPGHSLRFEERLYPIFYLQFPTSLKSSYRRDHFLANRLNWRYLVING